MTKLELVDHWRLLWKAWSTRMLAAAVAMPVALETMPDSVQKVASPHLIIAMWLVSVFGLVSRPFKQFDRPAAVQEPASPLPQETQPMSYLDDFEKNLLGAAEQTISNFQAPYGTAGAAIVKAIEQPTTSNRLAAAKAFIVAVETALSTPTPAQVEATATVVDPGQAQ